MEAIPVSAIAVTLSAQRLPRPDWLNPAHTLKPTDVPLWMALSYGVVRDGALIPGPMLGVAGGRLDTICAAPELCDQDGRLVLRCRTWRPPLRWEACRCGPPADPAWYGIVSALDLAVMMAGEILSDQACAHETELRTQADACASPEQRRKLKDTARKARSRRRTGEDQDSRLTHAEGMFVATMRTSAPKLPMEAVGQLGRWWGVVPYDWHCTYERSRSLERLAGRHLKPAPRAAA